MKLGRLNHIGVATPSIADSIAFYRDVMGATTIHEPFDLPEQGVKVCFVDTPTASGMNGTQIELIEPLPGNTSIASFLAKKGITAKGKKCHQYDLSEAEFIEPAVRDEDIEPVEVEDDDPIDIDIAETPDPVAPDTQTPAADESGRSESSSILKASREKEQKDGPVDFSDLEPTLF